MMYPAEWKKKDKVRGAVVIFTPPTRTAGEAFAASVNVTVQDLAAQTPCSLQDYVQEMVERERKILPGYELQSVEEAVLAGHPALRIRFTSKQGYLLLKFEQLCTIHRERAVAVTCAAEAGRFDEFRRTANLIVDSLALGE
ncbi:MAG: hypothetical protein QHH05_03130, partial [Syntrophomonadaceae bacterium]|jgi:hypothetical protein|nr:hypothetical protein [Syntrophomonadaceae bacterium]